MYVNTSQRVPPFTFFGTMRLFLKEIFFQKFMFFSKKNFLRFLSLRYGADFGRSRLVHLSFLRKSNPEFSAPTGFISPRKLHIRRPASIYLLRFDCALHFHIRMPYMAGCLSSPTAYSPSLSHSVSSA